jgi:hypothetical protein
VLGEKHYTASVVDGWMNEYGALVEWYLQEKDEYSYSPSLSGTNAILLL